MIKLPGRTLPVYPLNGYPKDTETEVFIMSARRCCICFSLEGDFNEKPGQIAHLDKDPSNSNFDNLAWLCLPHHDKYDSTTSQSKGLTINEVKRYRALLYKKVEEELREGTQRLVTQTWSKLQQPNEAEIVAEELKTERQIAQDRDQEAALQNYFDRMTELLLKEKLRESDEDSEVRSLARTRTLTVLRSLNDIRKGWLLRFLYESKLIDTRKIIIDLRGADLNAANLDEAILPEANLSGVSLIGAQLRKAMLFNANLGGANLTEAFMRGVYLYGANLEGVLLARAILHEAELSNAYLARAVLFEARLDGARLDNAELGKANLEGANLFGASLEAARLMGANLRGANLEGANLHGVFLEEANLEGVNLYRADLYDAILIRAKLENANLQGAFLGGTLLVGATYDSKTKWPDGFDPEKAGASADRPTYITF
jgi:uncharacterized protein YjbI with pentapeptide repeats